MAAVPKHVSRHLSYFSDKGLQIPLKINPMGTGTTQTLAGKWLPQISAGPAHGEGWWLSLPSTHTISAVLGALQL